MENLEHLGLVDTRKSDRILEGTQREVYLIYKKSLEKFGLLVQMENLGLVETRKSYNSYSIQLYSIHIIHYTLYTRYTRKSRISLLGCGFGCWV